MAAEVMLNRDIIILFNDHTWTEYCLPVKTGFDSSLPDELPFMYKGSDIKLTYAGFSLDKPIYKESDE